MTTTMNNMDSQASLDFVVRENGCVVGHALRGVLLRRDREFYVLLSPVGAEACARYRRRQARLVITEPGDNKRVLSRKVDIGVTTYIGTGLGVAGSSNITAEVLP